MHRGLTGLLQFFQGALSSLTQAGALWARDKLWVHMWFLWDLKCWPKTTLKDTGFPEDTSGGALSRWGGASPGRRGSPRRVGMAAASGPPKAEPRVGIAHQCRVLTRCRYRLRLDPRTLLPLL